MDVVTTYNATKIVGVEVEDARLPRYVVAMGYGVAVLAGLVVGAIVVGLGVILVVSFVSEWAVPVVVLPALAVAGMASAAWRGWESQRWFAAGVGGGGALAILLVAGLFAFAEGPTDRAQLAITKPRLVQLERSTLFRTAPPGLRLVEAGHAFRCSDSFDKREPSVWREYDLGRVAPTEAEAWLARSWDAAGFEPVGSDARRWERSGDGWTTSLETWTYEGHLTVHGSDAHSRVCQTGD